MPLLKGLIPGLDWLSVTAGAAIGIAVTFAPVYLYGSFKGARSERASIEAAAAREAFSRIQDMEKSNAKFRSLPARDRCVAFMRDSGLPVSECD